MPAPNVAVPLAPLREAVRRAVGETSALAVASDIGMSAPGLRNFLDGGTPRAATLRKLSEWYVRSAATAGALSEETALAALDLLLLPVPQHEREDAARSVLDTIRTAYQKHGAPIPNWLRSRS